RSASGIARVLRLARLFGGCPIEGVTGNGCPVEPRGRGQIVVARGIINAQPDKSGCPIETVNRNLVGRSREGDKGQPAGKGAVFSKIPIVVVGDQSEARNR